MAKVDGLSKAMEEGLGGVMESGGWGVDGSLSENREQGAPGGMENPAVLFQGFFVDGDVPSPTAGIGTVFVDASEIIVVCWNVVDHGILSFLLFYQCVK